MKKAILFDFGGTLDTDGIHWSEFFWNAYEHFNIPVMKKDFKDAFVYSERKIPGIIKPDFSLEKTYTTQLFYQFEYLESVDLLSGFVNVIANDICWYCLCKVLKNVETTKLILSLLEKEFELGLISNFYGNLETVLKELDLQKYFKVVIDSTVAGVRKPDRQIFEIAFDKLKTNPKEILMIGDSYENDILPAKKLGCTTVWLDVKSYTQPKDTSDADYTVKSLYDIEKILDKIIN